METGQTPLVDDQLRQQLLKSAGTPRVLSVRKSIGHFRQ